MTQPPAPSSLPAALSPGLEAVHPVFAAAVRATIENADAETGGGLPEVSDAVITEKTGHGWSEWVSLIDAGPGRSAGHTAIARWVHEEHGVDGWWAQGVTVGYERLVGLRLPGQMPDGTFTVQKNKTLDGTRDVVRGWLLSDAARVGLFPGLSTTLRSKEGAKQLRLGVSAPDAGDLGILGITVDEAKGRLKVNVTHDKLPSAAAGAAWKEAWGAWLDALAASGAANG